MCLPLAWAAIRTAILPCESLSAAFTLSASQIERFLDLLCRELIRVEHETNLSLILLQTFSCLPVSQPWAPSLVLRRTTAGYNDAARITQGGELGKLAFGVAGGKVWRLHVAADEVVKLRARIGEI
jgi:hypothetical protein